MKANEAPEKLYVAIMHPLSNGHTEMIASEHGDGVEYTRTDAFIEKALKFFSPHIQDNSGGYDRANVIEDFRNYMKGE
jgi:hypothetical protein